MYHCRMSFGLTAISAMRPAIRDGPTQRNFSPENVSAVMASPPAGALAGALVTGTVAGAEEGAGGGVKVSVAARRGNRSDFMAIPLNPQRLERVGARRRWHCV